jgi:alkanesulfonate monooxygenase SsuD/methylene tetrahydromethanopterin reductase-like flavin-dependent oxidoreductase (luciferase family)
MAPSPSVVLAALAQATSRIRIGAAVYCLPLYHPLRLLQELCTLDHLSGGRLDVGVGRGIRAAEHTWFGITPDEVRGRFEETLQIIIQGMTTGRLQHEGRFYRFDDLPLDLMPLQKPYPSLWYAGGAESAGRAGFNYLTRTLSDIERYWQLQAETERRPDRLNPGQQAPIAAITRHAVVRETYDEALAIARRSWPVFEEHWFATPMLLNEDGVARQGRSTITDFDEAVAADRRLLLGTPAMVRDKLRSWLDTVSYAPNLYFMPAVQWGDITTDEAMETMRLLAHEVLPALRD